MHETIDDLADEIGEEVDGEYPEFLSEVQDKAQAFIDRAQEDPAGSLKVVG